MYLEFESIYSRRVEKKELQLLDIMTLGPYLKHDDWRKIENCIGKILDLPPTDKFKILNDPTFHLFISRLNSQIINSFETKIEILSDRTLIDYINILYISISHLARNLIDSDSSFFLPNKSTLLPGTDILIYNNELGEHKYSHLQLPQVDGIKIFNKQIDPFFSETVVYNTECEFEIESWLKMLKDALSLIKLNPYCNILVTNFVYFIFPLKRKIDSIDFSFSSRNLPNVVFKNMENSAYLFGESLVHEGDHTFFYALEDIYYLWKKNANYQQEIYFSPWRDDPRPLEGILRGLSAFARVCMYYATLIESIIDDNERSTICRLLLLKINQCNDAANTLITSNQLSECGMDLVLEIKTIIDTIDFNATRLNQYDYWKTMAISSLKEKKDSWNMNNNIDKSAL